MTGWIESESKDGQKFLIDPYEVVSIVQNDDHTRLFLKTEDLKSYVESAESYETIKQKLMENSQVDFSEVTVERFTKEEYEHILDLYNDAVELGDAKGVKPGALTISIINKLTKILKEDK